MNLPPGLQQNDPKMMVAEAIEDLEKSVTFEPVNHAYLVALAKAHGMLGHYDRAAELLSTAVRVQPKNHNTRLLLENAQRKGNFWPKPIAR